MEDRGEVLYELSPKFDFLYELTMPTGKKMKSAIVGAIIAAIINIVLLVFRNDIISMNNTTYSLMYKACATICLIIMIFMILMAIARVILQSLEYKGIKYRFYKDCLVFENSFLNQTRKTIEYSNIKDIESYIESINNNCTPKDDESYEDLDKDALEKEYVMLSLRKIDGVNKNKFKIRYKKDIHDVFAKEIDELKKDNLIIEDETNIYLSKRGLEVANIVWERFI